MKTAPPPALVASCCPQQTGSNNRAGFRAQFYPQRLGRTSPGSLENSLPLNAPVPTSPQNPCTDTQEGEEQGCAVLGQRNAWDRESSVERRNVQRALRSGRETSLGDAASLLLGPMLGSSGQACAWRAHAPGHCRPTCSLWDLLPRLQNVDTSTSLKACQDQRLWQGA